jgi:hypothetical protein
MPAPPPPSDPKDADEVEEENRDAMERAQALVDELKIVSEHERRILEEK